MKQKVEMSAEIPQKIQTQESVSEEKKQQETLEEILKEIQKQKKMLKKTRKQVEQQQEMLNMIFRELTEKDPSVPSKSFFSMLDKFDFDIEKLMTLGTLVSNLYKNKTEGSLIKAPFYYR